VDTDSVSFFCLVCTTRDQFVSPPLATAEEMEAWACKNTTGAAYLEFSHVEWLHGARTTGDVFDLRRGTIHDAVHLIAKLKCGHRLTHDEAVKVDNFYRFLRYAVAPHQRSYDELEDLESAVDRLGLRPEPIKRSDDDVVVEFAPDVIQEYEEEANWYEIAGDAAYYVFGAEAYREKFRPEVYAVMGEVREPTEAECVLVGCYLSRLAVIAQIAGPSRLTAVQIVERFHRRSDG